MTSRFNLYPKRETVQPETALVSIGRARRMRASDVDLWLKLGCPNREDFEAARREAEPGIQ